MSLNRLDLNKFNYEGDYGKEDQAKKFTISTPWALWKICVLDLDLRLRTSRIGVSQVICYRLIMGNFVHWRKGRGIHEISITSFMQWVYHESVRGRGVCMAGGRCGRGGACMAGGACHAHLPPRQILRDTVIRSMSGRYASYWNAFLFHMSLLHFYCPPTKLREGNVFRGVYKLFCPGGWICTSHASWDRSHGRRP